MPIRCPACQAENSADARFCFRCGTALSPAPPPSDAVARVAPPVIHGAPVAPPPTWPAPGPSAPPSPPWSAPTAPAAPPTAIYPGPLGSPRPARPAAPRLLAFGCIGIGAAVLLLAVGFVILAVILPGGARRLPSQAAVTPVTGDLDAAIRAAVDASNRAQIEALHTLDDAPLRGVVVGRALDDNLQILADLQRSRVYAVSTLDHIDYQPARQLDADHASIRTVESWTTLYYRQGTNQLTRRQQSTGLQEIYYLVRQDGRWVVEQIDIRDPEATPAPNDTQ